MTIDGGLILVCLHDAKKIISTTQYSAATKAVILPRDFLVIVILLRSTWAALTTGPQIQLEVSPSGGAKVGNFHSVVIVR